MTPRSTLKRWLAGLSMALGAGVLALTAWLWFSLFSPWGYAPPPDLEPIDPSTTHQVFAYGTLRSSVLRRLVVGRSTPSQPATLPGFRRQGLTVVPQAGAQTAGELFVVDADELGRLDRYERLGVRYQRDRRVLESGESAWVYTRINDQNH